MKMTQSISAEPLLAKLDASQREAAMHGSGPALWLAGPGAGKTSTIVARVGRLICDGVPLDRILCTTFSTAGAQEMRRRIASITGLQPDDLRCTISTFHSQALRFLLQEKHRLPWTLAKDPVIPPSRERRILREIVGNAQIANAKRFIAHMRRKLIRPQQAVADAKTREEAVLAEAYRDYDAALRKDGLLDFDSMVYFAVMQYDDNQFTRAEWEGRYRFVIVDEAHDTSHDQAEFARRLARPENNLTFVGDKSQTIYRFRGADPSILNGKDSRVTYYLGVNYRSAQDIIDTFRPLSEQDEESLQLAERMRSANPDAKGSVEYIGFADEIEQSSAIADRIKELIACGLPAENYAVLSRTRALLSFIAADLEIRELPYHWSGKNFWLSSEVQDILGFAKLAVDQYDGEAVSRVICSQARFVKYLGPKFADAVLLTSERDNVSPLDVARPAGTWPAWRLSIWEEARKTLKQIVALAQRATTEQFLRRVVDICDLESGSSEPDDFSDENIAAVISRAAMFGGTLTDFLRHAEIMGRRTDSERGITLSTIHGSKGLEWESVFVIGVAAGVIPHQKAEDPEEERRILYVALSRARRDLTITYHRQPSEFLHLINANLNDADLIRADIARSAHGKAKKG